MTHAEDWKNRAHYSRIFKEPTRIRIILGRPDYDELRTAIGAGRDYDVHGDDILITISRSREYWPDPT